MSTPIANLPEITENQASKHITHNEGLRKIEALAFGSVVDRTLTAPPNTAVEGDLFIPDANSTGDWQGLDNKLVQLQEGGWDVYEPFEGLRVWDKKDDVLLVYDGSAWVQITSSGGSVTIQSLAASGATTGQFVRFSGTQWEPATIDLEDKVKVSASDTQGGFLESKLAAGTGITLTKVGSGGSETLRITTNNAQTPTISDASITGSLPTNGSVSLDLDIPRATAIFRAIATVPCRVRVYATNLARNTQDESKLILDVGLEAGSLNHYFSPSVLSINGDTTETDRLYLLVSHSSTSTSVTLTFNYYTLGVNGDFFKYADELNYGLAKKSSDVVAELDDEGFVTPRQLAEWRRAKLSSSDTQKSEVFISASDSYYPISNWSSSSNYGVGDLVIFGSIRYQALSSHLSSSNFNTDLDAGKWKTVSWSSAVYGDGIVPVNTVGRPVFLGSSVTYAELVAWNGNPNNKAIQLQPFDPDLNGFISLRDLDSAASWCDTNLRDSDTATLNIKPGKYYLNATFTRAVTLNGAYNSGQIGRYDGTDDLSVILYSIVVPTDFFGSLVLTARGTLNLYGGQNNTISNVHFWGAIKAVSDPTLTWVYKTSSDTLLASILSRYRSINTTAPSTLDIPWLSASRVNVKDSSLALSGCTLAPCCPTTDENANFYGGVSRPGYINLTDSTLTLTGCRIRGNEVWEIPTIEGTGKSWTSDWILEGSNYVGYGHCSSFISGSGSVRYRLGSDFKFSVGYGGDPQADRVTNNDLNNNRFEVNTDTLYGTTDTDYLGAVVVPSPMLQGSDNLGSNSGTGTVNSRGEILSRGPLIRYFFSIISDSTSFAPSAPYAIYNKFPNPTIDKTQGWRGKLGSIPVVSSSSISGTRQCVGLDAGLSFYGIGNTISDAQVQHYLTIWKVAGQNAIATAEGASNAVNVAATEFKSGVWINGTAMSGSNSTFAWKGLTVTGDFVI